METEVKPYNWARVPGRKWHYIGSGFAATSTGMVQPACSIVPGTGNAQPFHSSGAKFSVDVPPNKRTSKYRRYYGRELDHLCQHCVIAAAAQGYKF